jgi:hypothetical protein
VTLNNTEYLLALLTIFKNNTLESSKVILVKAIRRTLKELLNPQKEDRSKIE